MDYEKKYKDLVEAVKTLKEANPSDEGIQNWVKDNVPELQKSEDERIRKAIYIYLDWLEGRKDYAPKGKYSIRDMLAWLEKQVTPQVRTGIEWVNTIDDACDKRYSEEYAHGEYCHEQSFKWGFQEGVEWLEKQGEQKPAWSEEDESYLNTTIAYLKDAKEFKKTAENCINWLKSLRLQNRWKPSDEQMTALRRMKAAIAGEGEIYKPLNSLYEDLKKLREE